jgi:hypothetical protein
MMSSSSAVIESCRSCRDFDISSRERSSTFFPRPAWKPKLLDEQQISGTVIPLNDLIHDAYDRVIHYADSHHESVPSSHATQSA